MYQASTYLALASGRYVYLDIARVNGSASSQEGGRSGETPRRNYWITDSASQRGARNEGDDGISVQVMQDVSGGMK